MVFGRAGHDDDEAAEASCSGCPHAREEIEERVIVEKMRR